MWNQNQNLRKSGQKLSKLIRVQSEPCKMYNIFQFDYHMVYSYILTYYLTIYHSSRPRKFYWCHKSKFLSIDMSLLLNCIKGLQIFG